MTSGKVPLHRSLILRLLGTSVLVAVGAILATAWLTVHTTTNAIEDQQVRSLSDDTTIYDTLVKYAATHSGWNSVAPTVAELSRRTGHRVTLTTRDRVVLADSGTLKRAPLPRSAQPSAAVDPLHVNVTAGGATATGDLTSAAAIDDRAVGPYRLSPSDRKRLARSANQALTCLSKDPTARVAITPSGRPVVTSLTDSTVCLPPDLKEPTRSEAKALRALTRLTDECMHRKVSRSIEIRPLFVLYPTGTPLPPGVTVDAIQDCVQSARRLQLRPYVAPPVLLFVSGPEQASTQPSVTLTRRNVYRIAAGTALVLAVAVAVTVLVGVRLVRPLRRLTEAARRPIDQQEHVSVVTKDEIGYLATALNDLSDRQAQAEEQRTAMVSDVAHELRTPLTNIRSWLEAAKDGMTPTDSQLVDLLLEEAVLLQHVVDDLRDLAAADAGTLRLYPEFVHINDVLSQVVDAHGNAAEARNIRLSTAFSVDPQLSIDPVRVRQMIGNLVSNAIRHTSTGGDVVIRSTMSAESIDIHVADTGTGIDEESLPRIFDRFWRADDSRNRSTGGSGLGLAIARNLAEAHDGSLTVVSQVGVGSTFTVKLPRTRQAPESSPN